VPKAAEAVDDRDALLGSDSCGSKKLCVRYEGADHPQKAAPLRRTCAGQCEVRGYDDAAFSQIILAARCRC